MIDQELVDRVEHDIEVFERPSRQDSIELLKNYKQLIKENVELHKKLSAERVFVVNKGDENEL